MFVYPVSVHFSKNNSKTVKMVCLKFSPVVRNFFFRLFTVLSLLNKYRRIFFSFFNFFKVSFETHFDPFLFPQMLYKISSTQRKTFDLIFFVKILFFSIATRNLFRFFSTQNFILHEISAKVVHPKAVFGCTPQDGRGLVTNL